MKTSILLAAASALVAVAGPAAAQDRLTLGGVFADAAIEVQMVMYGLLAATLASVVVWGLEYAQVRKGRLEKTPVRRAFLSAVAGSAPMFGLAAAAYTLLRGAIGLSNVQPTPPLSVVAPGLAEALLSVVLGLLAAAVSTALRRHLDGRLEMWRGAGEALTPAE